MGRLTTDTTPTLLAYRERTKLSQADAADLAGITQSHWSRLENGETFASPKLAKTLTRLTGVPFETLLGVADSDSGANAGERRKSA